jgi:hypothetical protein
LSNFLQLSAPSSSAATSWSVHSKEIKFTVLPFQDPLDVGDIVIYVELGGNYKVAILLLAISKIEKR